MPPLHSRGIPKQRGTKSEMAASHLPSRGPKRGRKCYVTPVFLGVAYKGGQNQNWLPHPWGKDRKSPTKLSCARPVR